ncbi:Uncharacterised protein [Dermatophilus congolensis]|uniref:Uncharacterized protein n=1 Tax=Dermatophilus congolensis TaxID=1863 RepID=A0A239VMF4_9MICO|nr:Uncharacterised protein [Dermatophilus congolensis]
MHSINRIEMPLPEVTLSPVMVSILTENYKIPRPPRNESCGIITPASVD